MNTKFRNQYLHKVEIGVTFPNENEERQRYILTFPIVSEEDKFSTFNDSGLLKKLRQLLHRRVANDSKPLEYSLISLYEGIISVDEEDRNFEKNSHFIVLDYLDSRCEPYEAVTREINTLRHIFKTDNLAGEKVLYVTGDVLGRKHGQREEPLGLIPLTSENKRKYNEIVRKLRD